MADQRVSDFPSLTAGQVQAADFLPIIDSSESGIDRNKKITIGELVDYVDPLVAANNLSDVLSASAARANLNAAKAGANTDITSLGGLVTPLSETQGGTGESTYAAGQLLIGNNAGGLTKATLVAGAGITITNGDGSITIASNTSGTFTALSDTPDTYIANNFVRVNSGGTALELVALGIAQVNGLQTQLDNKQTASVRLDEITSRFAAASNGQVLIKSGGELVYSNATVTIENIGPTGVGVFSGRTGSTYYLRSLNSASSALTIVHNSGEDRIDFGITEGSLSLANIGGTLPIAKGGTGATSASAARTALGLAIGVNVQGHSQILTDISALIPTADNVLVGNGSTFVLRPRMAKQTVNVSISSATNSAAFSLPYPINFARISAATGSATVATLQHLASDGTTWKDTDLTANLSTSETSWDSDQLARFAALSGGTNNLRILLNASGSVTFVFDSLLVT